MTKLNNECQPTNVKFNAQRNRNKASAVLKGIISGLGTDGKLTDTEILFLKQWLECQKEMKGDLLDIYDSIQDIVSDGVITEDERDDINCLLNDCIEYSPTIFEGDAKINEMIGFLKGIIADGEVSRIEFEKLIELVNSNFEMKDSFPFNIMRKRIDKILNDGKVTNNELTELCSYIGDITGTKFTSDGDVLGGATTLFDEDISINNYVKKICFTGKFLVGTRKDVENMATQIGMHVQSNVTTDLDIVVIGTLCSRDWIHESTGRKIELALKNRENGHKLIITNEKKWLTHLNE